ncbi:MAG: carboxypeptidase-like regulatory domain-containing protein, partial [Gemmatimonadota bacterium]
MTIRDLRRLRTMTHRPIPAVPCAAIPRALLAAALLALAPAPAAAQVGMGTDIITGVVTGTDGAPLQDATVEAYSLETQVTRRGRTDARGRYTILFPDGGGQYRMTARVIGHSPRTVLLVRDADEDRLVWNVRLAEGAVAIEAITVRAGPTIQRGQDAPTPGASERAFNPDVLARIPLDATDLSVLAGLSPGVLSIASTDSTAAAFSVAGLGPDANALTLDGLLFGTATVPQEGLRQTRVVTSTYDVSRGQFSGGLIASTTRSGSNMVQGSSQAQLRDEDLAINAGDSPYTQGFTQNVYSGGLGGPLIRDRIFVFGSLQARLRSDPQQTLLSAGDADYARLGVSPDSVTRFLGLANLLGVRPLSVTGGATRASDNLSGLVRLDLVLSNEHTLTLRGDWRGNSQDPARLGPLALPQSGGEVTSSGGGAMATLSSRFGATVLNEFRGYLQNSRSDGGAYSEVPQGRVQVTSLL